MLTYDAAEPRFCKPSVYPPYSPPELAHARITVLGKAYGNLDMSLVLSVGNTRCLETRWWTYADVC
jgi:hypothetical protein